MNRIENNKLKDLIFPEQCRMYFHINYVYKCDSYCTKKVLMKEL